MLLIYDLCLRNILSVSGIVTALRVHDYTVAEVLVVNEKTVIHIIFTVKVHDVLVFSYQRFVPERIFRNCFELPVADRDSLFDDTALDRKFGRLSFKARIQHQFI